MRFWKWTDFLQLFHDKKTLYWYLLHFGSQTLVELHASRM